MTGSWFADRSTPLSRPVLPHPLDDLDPAPGALPPAASVRTDARVISLPSEWRFRWYPSPALAPRGVGDPSFDDSEWGTIAVPSSFVMPVHGATRGGPHGAPAYTNQNYPFPVDPPFLRTTTRSATTGSGSPSTIRPTAPSCASPESREPRTSGSTASSRLDAGQPTAHGLRCRGTGGGRQSARRARPPVQRRLVPRRPGRLVAAGDHPRGDPVRAPGRARSTTCASWPTGPGRRAPRLEVATDSTDVRAATGGAGDRGADRRDVVVPGARPWSAEAPALYTLRVSTPDETVETSIGFRTIAIVDGIFTVNGAPVQLRGVNRHEHHPRYGRHVPADVVEAELLLMKRHNINAIRTRTIRPTPLLLDLADRLGLLGHRRVRPRDPRLRPRWTGAAIPPTTRAWEPACATARRAWSSATRTIRASSCGRSATRRARAQPRGDGRRRSGAGTPRGRCTTRATSPCADVDVWSRMYAHPAEVPSSAAARSPRSTIRSWMHGVGRCRSCSASTPTRWAPDPGD